MWAIVNLDEVSGTFKTVSQFATAEECVSGAPDVTSRRDAFVLWEGEYPDDKAERQAVIAKIFALNPGKVLWVLPGVQVAVSKTESSRSTCHCPGRCFCVHEGGGCHCGAPYCRPEGCIWVRCPGGC
jgi:hypothetical protein